MEGLMAVPVGLNVWSRLVEELFPYLDQVVDPFDSLWFPDHVQYEQHKVAEGWSLLAFALARYPDKLCGHDVLCNSFRNPAHLAKMAATAQTISGGRVVLGLGAGWHSEEYQAYGWPFPSARVRIAQLAESIQLIRALWSNAPATYHGQHYQVTNAYCEPRPNPAPPIMVGGAGEQYLLRVVAEHADWWNYVFSSPEEYRQKQTALKRHCQAVGRDYDTIVQVVHVGVLVAENERAVQRLRERADVRPLENGVIGTPEQVATTLRAIVGQGAGRLTVHLADAPRPDGTQLFGAQVIPQLGA
jgi:alkanesulfonate monooxygenase SsuD/methylene tetrahydromethanopterin reductase-like flavin-dependent oxidoreductase (luciferase family)